MELNLEDQVTDVSTCMYVTKLINYSVNLLLGLFFFSLPFFQAFRKNSWASRRTK